jgi:hypothetical protein
MFATCSTYRIFIDLITVSLLSEEEEQSVSDNHVSVNHWVVTTSDCITSYSLTLLRKPKVHCRHNKSSHSFVITRNMR